MLLDCRWVMHVCNGHILSTERSCVMHANHARAQHARLVGCSQEEARCQMDYAWDSDKDMLGPSCLLNCTASRYRERYARTLPPRQACTSAGKPPRIHGMAPACSHPTMTREMHFVFPSHAMHPMLAIIRIAQNCRSCRMCRHTKLKYHAQLPKYCSK